MVNPNDKTGFQLRSAVSVAFMAVLFCTLAPAAVELPIRTDIPMAREIHCGHAAAADLTVDEIATGQGEPGAGR